MGYIKWALKWQKCDLWMTGNGDTQLKMWINVDVVFGWESVLLAKYAHTHV